MKINGRPITIMAFFQILSVLMCTLGAHLGHRLFEKVGPSYFRRCWDEPFLCRLGGWLLVVPLAWTIVVFIRTRRDAPYWEICLWFVLAILFCTFAGGSGVVAVIRGLGG